MALSFIFSNPSSFGLAMYGIIHGGPVVPLTLIARQFVSSTTGILCRPKVYVNLVNN